MTDAGDALLEVDHIVEIAGDGRDHPSQMIALCPNCHAVKTRGRTRHHVRAVLLEVVRELHEQARARGVAAVPGDR
ncbi:HNH endonuclease [Streptomyces sp. NPDC003006]